tara:strand:- start:20887 stop:21267 length:381 start_codon:yes stop_codon:yes gene_type:complete
MSELTLNIILLLSGLILGILAHKLFAKSSKKIRRLTNKLKEQDNENKALQNNLNNYFDDANDLASKLAEDYQTLISKLSEGTRKFSSFNKNMYYPAITNNLNNPGIEKNIPYTVDSLNNSNKDKST